MDAPNPKTEAFFRDAVAWHDELSALRSILRASPLVEDFKWRAPCYTYRGGNVATVWGLKDCCTLSFFKGALLTDPEALLDAPGANSRSMRVIRFTGRDQIHAMEDTLRTYIDAAIAIETAGLKVNFAKDDLAYPEELIDRLDGAPELATAFAALTPGRRRGYLLHFAQAKRAATRTSRIDKAAPRILAGKGLHDR
ncbi:YdeI/OmpD-associated family protein [Acidimangrovimonas pyrenivorans]|uniref:YdeI family protein n=1 Tax=Acidimangrovimonas pyrenivorans TaxID=2030798 RepID=A0ABV7AIY4_9RHOB